MQNRFFSKIRVLFSVVIALLAAASVLHAAAPRSVRVLVWDEQQPEQKLAYGEKFLGETIAAHLAARPGLVVKSVSLASPSQGLDEATLNDADVVIWWIKMNNPFGSDDTVVRLLTSGREVNLGFIWRNTAHS